MEISKNLLVAIQITTALFVILVAVAISFIKYLQIVRKRPLTPYPKIFTLLGSSLILSAAVQLPGRSLSGSDGFIIVLDLLAIIVWLIAINVMIWKNK